MSDSLGGLPDARAVLGSYATLHRVFGLGRLGGPELAKRWEALCGAAGVDPIIGPSRVDDDELAVLVEALPELRSAAPKHAKTPMKKAIAGLFNLCGYEDPSTLPDDQKGSVEYVRAAGKGRPAFDPGELPRLRVLELHDNGLEDDFFEESPLTGLSQLMVVTLHGNRLTRPPELPSSVRYKSLRRPALVRHTRGSVAASSGPAAEAKVAGQLLQAAAGAHLLALALSMLWALTVFVYSIGLCCPILLLPLLPIAAGITDLMMGSALARGERAVAARGAVGMTFSLSVLLMVGLNFGLLIFPLALAPVVLEFIALTKLGRRDVVAWMEGAEDDAAGQDPPALPGPRD